jgi:hypothetical protein
VEQKPASDKRNGSEETRKPNGKLNLRRFCAAVHSAAVVGAVSFEV